MSSRMGRQSSCGSRPDGPASLHFSQLPPSVHSSEPVGAEPPSKASQRASISSGTVRTLPRPISMRDPLLGFPAVSLVGGGRADAELASGLLSRPAPPRQHVDGDGGADADLLGGGMHRPSVSSGTGHLLPLPASMQGAQLGRPPAPLGGSQRTARHLAFQHSSWRAPSPQQVDAGLLRKNVHPASLSSSSSSTAHLLPRPAWMQGAQPAFSPRSPDDDHILMQLAHEPTASSSTPHVLPPSASLKGDQLSFINEPPAAGLIHEALQCPWGSHETGHSAPYLSPVHAQRACVPYDTDLLCKVLHQPTSSRSMGHAPSWAASWQAAQPPSPSLLPLPDLPRKAWHRPPSTSNAGYAPSWEGSTPGVQSASPSLPPLLDVPRTALACPSSSSDTGPALLPAIAMQAAQQVSPSRQAPHKPFGRVFHPSPSSSNTGHVHSPAAATQAPAHAQLAVRPFLADPDLLLEALQQPSGSSIAGHDPAPAFFPHLPQLDSPAVTCHGNLLGSDPHLLYGSSDSAASPAMPPSLRTAPPDVTFLPSDADLLSKVLRQLSGSSI